MNKIDKTLLSITYRLENIQTQKFVIESKTVSATEITDAYFEFMTWIGWNKVEKRILVKFEIKVFDNPPKELYSTIELHYLFAIDNIDLLFDTDDKPIIPDKFIFNLLSIVYGTSRGILYEKFKGTFLNKILLPPMDPANLMKKPTPVLEEQVLPSI